MENALHRLSGMIFPIISRTDLQFSSTAGSGGTSCFFIT